MDLQTARASCYCWPMRLGYGLYMGIIGLYWGYIGIMEKKMETIGIFFNAIASHRSRWLKRPLARGERLENQNWRSFAVRNISLFWCWLLMYGLKVWPRTFSHMYLLE